MNWTVPLRANSGETGSKRAPPAVTGPTASRVIAFLALSEKGIKMAATDQFGVVTDGRFTPLPKLVVGDANDLAF